MSTVVLSPLADSVFHQPRCKPVETGVYSAASCPCFPEVVPPYRELDQLLADYTLPVVARLHEQHDATRSSDKAKPHSSLEAKSLVQALMTPADPAAHCKLRFFCMGPTITWSPAGAAVAAAINTPTRLFHTLTGTGCIEVLRPAQHGDISDPVQQLLALFVVPLLAPSSQTGGISELASPRLPCHYPSDSLYVEERFRAWAVEL